MESSDVGEYGMNTPAYFCIDNFSATTITSSDLIFMEDAGANVFPNPVKDSFCVAERWFERYYADRYQRENFVSATGFKKADFANPCLER